MDTPVWRCPTIATPGGKTAGQIIDEIMADLVPGAIAILAAVFEIVRLREKGHNLVVNH